MLLIKKICKCTYAFAALWINVFVLLCPLWIYVNGISNQQKWYAAFSVRICFDQRQKSVMKKFGMKDEMRDKSRSLIRQSKSLSTKNFKNQFPEEEKCEFYKQTLRILNFLSTFYMKKWISMKLWKFLLFTII